MIKVIQSLEPEDFEKQVNDYLSKGYSVMCISLSHETEYRAVLMQPKDHNDK